MKVVEYLRKYGDMEIIDKENQKVFKSSTKNRAIGGMLKAGDFKRLGCF